MSEAEVTGAEGRYEPAGTPSIIEGPDVILPLRTSRLDGRPISPQRRTVRFAEALAFDDSWSRISDARRKPLL